MLMKQQRSAPTTTNRNAKPTTTIGQQNALTQRFPPVKKMITKAPSMFVAPNQPRYRAPLQPPFGDFAAYQHMLQRMSAMGPMPNQVDTLCSCRLTHFFSPSTRSSTRPASTSTIGSRPATSSSRRSSTRRSIRCDPSSSCDSPPVSSAHDVSAMSSCVHPCPRRICVDRVTG